MVDISPGIRSIAVREVERTIYVVRRRALVRVVVLVALAVLVAKRPGQHEVAAARVEVDAEILRRCTDGDGALPHLPIHVRIQDDTVRPFVLARCGCEWMSLARVLLVGGEATLDFPVIA